MCNTRERESEKRGGERGRKKTEREGRKDIETGRTRERKRKEKF